MSLTRRNFDPFHQFTKDLWNDDLGFESMLRRIDNLESSLLPDKSSAQLQSFRPKVDVKETEKSYEITAEFPGLEKKDISIELDEESRTLTLSGKRIIESDKSNDRYHYRERSSGSFKRSFRLPEDVHLEQVKAHMDHGLLQIQVPKTEKRIPKTRSIQIV